jgi:predicted transcriptional regulator of viral defense system
MNFVQFKNSLRDFPVFSIADIRAAHGGFDRRRLSEWQKKGYIIKIIKGYYLFSDLDIDESTLLAIANKIYKPSYISFETAMSYYRLIPESVYMITSASTRRTSLFDTPMARFSYRTIKPSLFFGYSLLTGGIKMAFVEKAILDYLYINPAVRIVDDFASLRINREEMLSQVRMERLTGYLQRFNHKRLSKTMKHFLGWLYARY